MVPGYFRVLKHVAPANIDDGLLPTRGGTTVTITAERCRAR
jgi:hypothetical protein